MISLIIVDDEMTIRKGLSQEFDWSAYDIELVGQASNGKDGLALAKMVQPDIIITDIKMPIMSGLDMSKEITEKLPNTKIIFLTGYSDFNYAKQALSLKAVEYLLKPVNFTELANIIKEICSQIRQQKDNQEKRENEERYFKQALPYLRARILTQFANEQISFDDFYNKAKELSIPVSKNTYSVGFIQFDDLMRNLELSSLYQRNFCDLLINKTVDLYFSSQTEYSIAYFDSKLFLLIATNDEEENIEKFWHKLKNSISEQLKATVSIGVSTYFKDSLYMGKALYEASAALELRVKSEEESSVINFEGPLANIIPIISISSNEEKTLLEYLRHSDTQKVEQFLDMLIDKYITKILPQKSREQFCISLIRLVVREGSQFGLTLKDLIGENRNIYLEMENQSSLEHLKEWLQELFSLMSTTLSLRESSAPPTIITVSMAWAKEHYYQPLSVSEIAERMKVTANYFSRLFKKWTGVNFVEWLNSYRIEEAKRQLLYEPDKKIYEIANDTGFNDYKYFAYIFKKYIGCTPQSYRDLRVGFEINNKGKGE